MQSRPTKLTIRFKRVETGTFRVKTEDGFSGSTFSDHLDSTLHQPTNVISLEEDDHGPKDENSQSYENGQNHLVVYDPASNYRGQTEAIPDPIWYPPPRPTKLTVRVRRVETGTSRVKTEENGFNGSTFLNDLDDTLQQPTNVISLEEDDHGAEDENSQCYENAQNQLLVFDPAVNYTGEIEAIPDPIWYQPPPFPRYCIPNQPSRILPSVGAFTVQCARCFKWRLIPTKEKYEEIREHILEQYFVCETAREWQPDISCEHPADITQDGSRLWAIDKPNIAQPPPGWQRLLRIRSEGSTKFADVYYVAPSGKSLRSMVEIQKYLLEHPEYMAEGATVSQFSFQIPRPLQENYVRKNYGKKHPARFAAPYGGTNMGLPEPLETSEVNSIAWAGPDESADLQFGGPGLYNPYFEAPVFDPVYQPPKKARSSRPKPTCKSNWVYYQQDVNLEPHFARRGAYDL
ncbi:methyl-CpG-binding domain-containing protein 2-like [Cornus florida]|uniref:methyl-CpG-binding domain-containing protein 2-like n=1 Tax=Cornus florida TaxID=4283 RepID=UPI00289F9105|nr:methyl-CpG-binding domain-containing protein 2-like [Cornus florida]